MSKYREVRDRLLQKPEVQAGYEAQAKMQALGQLVRTARAQASISQQGLAELSGVTQSDVSRLESGLGIKGPTLDTLRRLAHALGMILVVELVPQSMSTTSVTDVSYQADALRVAL